MKFNLIKTPPKDVYLAFSGGVDSVVLLDALLSRKVNVTLLTIDHGTEFSKQEIEFACKVSEIYNLQLITTKIADFDKSTSLESFWSRQRFDIFQRMSMPVLTGHHLDDAVEWYVMSSMQGQSKVLDYQSGNVLRPMLLNSKEDIIKYANKSNLYYLTDPTNSDTSFNLRNKVRHELIGNIKNCFPGIANTVKKLIVKKTKLSCLN